MESKYLEKFTKLENRKDLYRINGGRVLVELLAKEEVKTAGGLIMSAPSGYAKGSTFDSQRGTMGVILLTGEGYIDSDGTPFLVDLKPGNVVCLNDFGVKTLSVFPGLKDYAANSLALVDESAVQIVWPDIETFGRFEQVLAD